MRSFWRIRERDGGIRWHMGGGLPLVVVVQSVDSSRQEYQRPGCVGSGRFGVRCTVIGSERSAWISLLSNENALQRLLTRISLVRGAC